MFDAVPIDNQPISSTFFGQGKWLTDFITPDSPDIQKLCAKLVAGKVTKEEKAVACWSWVAREVKYTPYVRARMEIEGQVSSQEDAWLEPALTSRALVGNCANKSFLLTSLLRNFISESHVGCTLGNLYQNGEPGGHAWVEVQGTDGRYVMETTRDDIPPFNLAANAKIYEPVMYFNDKGVSAIPGRTVLTPFSAVYADWLRDYLDFAYIEGRK